MMACIPWGYLIFLVALLVVSFPVRKILSWPRQEVAIAITTRSLTSARESFAENLKSYSSLEREIGAISLERSPLESFIQLGTEDWMSLLDNETLLSDISIPGTHDTVAYVKSKLCHTQKWDLLEQLRSGIRYLDIRCRPKNNFFNIHHGACFLHQRFEDVMDTVSAFLTDHPGEVIIMRIKNEFRPSHHAQEFEMIWNRYLNELGYGTLFVGNLNTVPTLGDVRGRIICVSNETGPRPNYGFQFSSGGSFTEIQDQFRIRSDEDMVEKVERVFSFMEQAISSPRLTFNHLSGTGIPRPHFFPTDIATVTNEAAYNLIGFGEAKRALGILIIDYPGEGLLARTLLTNFGQETSDLLRMKDQITLYSTAGCAGDAIGTLDYPGEGGSITVNFEDDTEVVDNSARSILFQGPVDAGTRMHVGGRNDMLGQSDSTIVTFTNDVLDNETVCVQELQDSVVEMKFVQYFQPYLEMKTNLPTSFRIERPTAATQAFSTEVTKDLQWTKNFCHGKSMKELQGGPIAGWVRSRVLRGCQTLAQTTPQACSEGTSYWTGIISWLRHDTKCKPGYYVGQVKCFGVKCFRVALHCFRASDRCVLDAQGASSVRRVRDGEEFHCPFGSILTGVKCKKLRCAFLTGFCTKVSFVE